MQNIMLNLLRLGWTAALILIGLAFAASSEIAAQDVGVLMPARDLHAAPTNDLAELASIPRAAVAAVADRLDQVTDEIVAITEGYRKDRTAKGRLAALGKAVDALAKLKNEVVQAQQSEAAIEARITGKHDEVAREAEQNRGRAATLEKQIAEIERHLKAEEERALDQAASAARLAKTGTVDAAAVQREMMQAYKAAARQKRKIHNLERRRIHVEEQADRDRKKHELLNNAEMTFFRLYEPLREIESEVDGALDEIESAVAWQEYGLLMTELEGALAQGRTLAGKGSGLRTALGGLGRAVGDDDDETPSTLDLAIGDDGFNSWMKDLEKKLAEREAAHLAKEAREPKVGGIE